jgi:uncharacterized OB-fold protein
MSSDHHWVELGNRAELLTFTYVQLMPTSFVDYDPYVVAVGRLDEGLNILAWLEGVADPITLKPGARLRLETRKGPDGTPYYVFVSQPG